MCSECLVALALFDGLSISAMIIVLSDIAGIHREDLVNFLKAPFDTKGPLAIVIHKRNPILVAVFRIERIGCTDYTNSHMLQQCCLHASPAVVTG